MAYAGRTWKLKRGTSRVRSDGGHCIAQHAHQLFWNFPEAVTRDLVQNAIEAHRNGITAMLLLGCVDVELDLLA
jgi:hypothetical protein